MTPSASIGFPRWQLALAAAALSLCTLARADAPPDRYAVDSAQMTVTDKRTGLIWQQPVSTASYTFADASSYCQGLLFGTTSSFRLPTFKELMTLIDPTRSNPAIDRAVFPGTPTAWFWTASNLNPSGPAAISLMTGETTFFRATDMLRVRCVR